MRNISAILGNVMKEGKAAPEPEFERIPGGSISPRGMGGRERGRPCRGTYNLSWIDLSIWWVNS
jgi:hypothetical protein